MPYIIFLTLSGTIVYFLLRPSPRPHADELAHAAQSVRPNHLSKHRSPSSSYESQLLRYIRRRNEADQERVWQVATRWRHCRFES
jgi:hypothetical protein